MSWKKNKIININGSGFISGIIDADIQCIKRKVKKEIVVGVAKYRHEEVYTWAVVLTVQVLGIGPIYKIAFPIDKTAQVSPFALPLVVDTKGGYREFWSIPQLLYACGVRSFNELKGHSIRLHTVENSSGMIKCMAIHVDLPGTTALYYPEYIDCDVEEQ